VRGLNVKGYETTLKTWLRQYRKDEHMGEKMIEEAKKVNLTELFYDLRNI
jgi:hypothetical protein